ncbi:unnamed protein product [Parnassius apollo]|uniref:(apollo) hypothetical protein n=1 Tax=Parnassius apollo TaxID=110799 RepID=A0A8S3Y311_PARAO|nr:unnamed protein product [Parnassius apollo]
MSIVEFRKSLVDYLTSSSDSQHTESGVTVSRPKRLKHELLTKTGTVRNTRRFCVHCYKDMVKQFGRKLAKNKAKKGRHIEGHWVLVGLIEDGSEDLRLEVCPENVRRSVGAPDPEACD